MARDQRFDAGDGEGGRREEGGIDRQGVMIGLYHSATLQAPVDPMSPEYECMYILDWMYIE
jgi:hypothetical protein